jgi:hypothetical protein
VGVDEAGELLDLRCPGFLGDAFQVGEEAVDAGVGAEAESGVQDSLRGKAVGLVAM